MEPGIDELEDYIMKYLKLDPNINRLMQFSILFDVKVDIAEKRGRRLICPERISRGLSDELWEDLHLSNSSDQCVC